MAEFEVHGRRAGVERAVDFYEALLAAVQTGVNVPSAEALRLTGTGTYA